MRVIGNIGNVVEKKTDKAGKPFYRFSLAESFGKGDKKTTSWYEVTAFVDQAIGDKLAKGQLVEVSGKLEAKTFNRKDGSHGVGLDLTGFSVAPAQLPKAAELATA